MPKAQTTSNDALIAESVDQDIIDAFDLSPHLIRLMWDEPFFATILRIIKKRETKQNTQQYARKCTNRKTNTTNAKQTTNKISTARKILKLKSTSPPLPRPPSAPGPTAQLLFGCSGGSTPRAPQKKTNKQKLMEFFLTENSTFVFCYRKTHVLFVSEGSGGGAPPKDDSGRIWSGNNF